MKNIFKKLIASFLICMMLISGMSYSGFATEEGLEIVTEAPAPEVKPEPEVLPEPAPEPEPEPVPAPEPEEKTAPSGSEEEASNEGSDGEDSSTDKNTEPPAEGSGNEGSTDNGDIQPVETEVPVVETMIPEEKEPIAEVTSEPTISPEAGVEVTAPVETVSAACIVSFDPNSIPQDKKVTYGTPENELGFPGSLRAIWSNGSSNDVKVIWKCVDDGNGGSAYIPSHENLESVYTFAAVLNDGEPCSAELPAVRVAYEPVEAPVDIKPLAWKDVIVEVEEKEYACSYKSVSLNVLKGYELGLSVKEDREEEPDSELKAKVDDSEENYNVIIFSNLESAVEYTVWAKQADAEEWTAFEKSVKTEAVTVELLHQEVSVAADKALFVGEQVSATSNLESPVFRWYRAGREEPVYEGADYVFTLDDVGTGVKCVASEAEYTGETIEIQAILPEAEEFKSEDEKTVEQPVLPTPAEFRLDTVNETLTVVFSEIVPAGANVVLANLADEVIATAEAGEEGCEFAFDGLRTHAGNTVKVYIELNGVRGDAKEFAVVPAAPVPEMPEQDKVVFLASSQRSIDFSCEDAVGLEFAYRATGSGDVLTVIPGNPEAINDLAVQTDYTLYIRRAASDASFASEWVETGFHATTNPLEVVVAQADSIYFDSTITASPAGNCLFAEGYPAYQWYFSGKAAFDDSAKLLEDAHGAVLNLQEHGFSKADIGKYILVSISDGYGNTSAAKSIQLRRYDDPLLSLNVGERILVGETVKAAYNGEGADLTWEWYRGEEIISGANTASYTAVAEDANNVLTVNAIRNGAIAASAYVAVDRCALVAVVDYEKETIAVSVNDSIPEGWILRVTDESGAFIDKAWPQNTSSVSYKLAELGISPDRPLSPAPDYTVALGLLNAIGEGESLRITLPARKDYSGMPLDMNAVIRNAAEVTFVVPSGLNIALSMENSDAPDFSLGGGPGFSLKEGAQYKVWLQDAAVPGVSFASKWMAMHTIDTVDTGVRKELSVSLKSSSITWKPNMEIPGLNISSSDVNKNDISRSWYDADGKALNGEPVNAGKYTLHLSLRGNAAKQYKLKESKLSLTIEPIAMSAKNTRVTCEQLIYNGKEQLPRKMKVIVDGIEIPAGEFKIEKVSGYDCTSAGSHIIKIVGGGNVSGGIKMLYVISVAKPLAISWPTASYLVTGQKLSESKLVGGSTNAGSFAWENGSIVPPTGVSKHNVVFTPADTSNYDWSGVTMVKPVEVKVYYVAPSGGDSTETDSDYNYDYSASTGYWDSGSEEGEAENSSGRLAEAYLSAGTGSADLDALEIVYDVTGRPMDYELLAIQDEAEETDGFAGSTFMIIAQPDMEGEIVSRFLRLSLAQLDYLHRDLEFNNLLFRNGDAELWLRQSEVLAGNVAKLAAYMINSGADGIDLTSLDFASMDEPALDRDELARLWLEMRIDPAVVRDEVGGTEKDAWDVSLWLCTESLEVDISTLAPSFSICLNVNGLFDKIGQDKFVEENGIALMNEDTGKLLLQSELVQVPGELPAGQADQADYYVVLMPIADDAVLWTDYIPGTSLKAYRNFALAVPYAGPGMYMLEEIE